MLVVLTGAADAAWILTRFARQLGVEEPRQEREALVAQIYEQLAIVREDGRHAVLLIDDAQTLASGQTLAEVAGLLKLEYEDRRLLTLALAGGPQLEAAIDADPVLAGRIEARVRVEPFSAEAGQAYLAHRIQRAGGAIAILEEPAAAALHELAGGLPGRMNLLADNALFEAFLCNRRAVTRADVERAFRDLAGSGGSAPAPTVAPAAALAAATAAQPAPAGAAPLLPDAGPGGEPGAGLVGLAWEVVAVVAGGAGGGAAARDPSSEPTRVRVGPPKDSDDEVEDLLVELLDD
jgi:general secretion pathway protein A